MSSRGGPYEDTSVPVGVSQARIRDMLRKAGAEGVYFAEEWHPPKCIVRFVWPLPAGKVIVRLEAHPLEATSRLKVDQRERQAWRGLYWYLEGTLKAATFGLVRFEEVFLAHIEDPSSGRRIGDVLIPELEAGRLALPKRASS